MGSILIDQLPNSILGLKGLKPDFRVDPNPPNSRHNTYSINGDPNIKLIGINKVHSKPLPSSLDLNGLKPKAYLDNPPK